MELIIMLGLLLLNGVFALSEIAVLSARKARLNAQAEAGDTSAQAALDLAESPDKFLSTIQIGITLVGILLGAFGGSALATDLANTLRPTLGEAAEPLSVALIVALTTYLSLVIGELVPKRLALIAPEAMARRVARPMTLLSRLTTPLVWLLGQSTNLAVRLLGVDPNNRTGVTNAEVVMMVREGIDDGLFGESEDEMVAGVLGLDEMRISKIITPRTETIWLPLDGTRDEIRDIIMQHPFSAYPVARNSLDDVVGIVRAKDILASLLNNNELDLPDLMYKPHFIPESVTVDKALETFKRSGVHTALIISEYGGIEGMVRMHDIIELIFGELDVPGVDYHDPDMVQRADGSWLIDGGVPLDNLQTLYPSVRFPPTEGRTYDTIAGFVMAQLGRIPQVTDAFAYGGLQFEVVDMDEVRIDKVQVKAEPPAQADA